MEVLIKEDYIMRHKLTLLIVAVALLSLLISGCTVPSKSGSKDSKSGKDFTLKDLDGNDVKLADYRGKVVVLDFWATWCGPCKKEIPTFKQLQENYGEHPNFALITIVNDSGSVDEIREFIDEYSLNYTVILGERQIIEDFAIVGFPTTLVLNKDGGVEKTILGSQRNLYNMLSNKIDALLES